MAKTQVIYADRAGKDGVLRLGCTAILFDASRQKVLLTRRADNGQWCLPGGGAEAGESVSEACLRELREETGLEGNILRLTGVYSDPNRLVIYPDGAKIHFVSLCFEVEAQGTPGLSDETTEWAYFSPQEIPGLDMLLGHAERITDALQSPSPVVR